MRIGTTAAVAGLTIALAGCGGSHERSRTSDSVVTSESAAAPLSAASPTSAPSEAADRDDAVVRPPVAPPRCPAGPSVHFATPEAAMTYLAAAWNRNDLAALCQVTNPNARFLLNDMHREAVNLQLIRCKSTGVGAYQCVFQHDYPKAMHKTGTGRTWLDVGAADNPGYYMTVYEGCG